MSVPSEGLQARSALSLALYLASLGWHVLPLSSTSKRPLGNCRDCQAGSRCAAGAFEECRCLPAGRWCHAAHAATTDPQTLERWWRSAPNAIPAVAAGPSGLVLIDLDAHTDQRPTLGELLPGVDLEAAGVDEQTARGIRNGADVLRLLGRLRGGDCPWPTDPAQRPVTVATPSGGRHLWYLAPDGELRQAIGTLGWQIDIKAGWNYGIAPSAVTARGTYEILAGNLAAPGQMSAWLAREVIRVASRVQPARPVAAMLPAAGNGPAAYVSAVIIRGLADLAPLADGRKQALSRLAYQIGGLLAWSGLARYEIEDQLISGGISSGLDERDARRAVVRSLDNGLRFPLTGPRQRTA